MTARQSISTVPLSGCAFADPDWRGDQGPEEEGGANLRPLAGLMDQERRIENWIRGGSCYGWLNAYEARRAAFELQSIRTQRRQGALAAACRRPIQSRLDRLEGALGEARSAREA